MTTQPSPRQRPSTGMGVICKNCQHIHYFTGVKNGMVPYRLIGGKYSIWCQKDGSWHEYELTDEESVYQETVTTSGNEELITRIIEMENRLTKLETKTAELPEKEGIKQLRESIKNDFTGFLADALKEKDSGATYG